MYIILRCFENRAPGLYLRPGFNQRKYGSYYLRQSNSEHSLAPCFRYSPPRSTEPTEFRFQACHAQCWEQTIAFFSENRYSPVYFAQPHPFCNHHHQVCLLRVVIRDRTYRNINVLKAINNCQLLVKVNTAQRRCNIHIHLCIQ